MWVEREMFEDKNGSYIVIILSDKFDLNGIFFYLRLSGFLVKESDIFYIDLNSGKVIYKWEVYLDIFGGGIWIKI